MMGMFEAANIVNGNISGADCMFRSVTTDSRSVGQGDLFVAIPGQSFDGHDFISDAQSRGAVGAMVSSVTNSDIPQIKVSDTTAALGKLASQWRSRFDVPVMAITGSNGKTTVVSMIASILNTNGNCLSPDGSYNNQWGVPLTLLKLRNDFDYAVIEMGTNHPGEIKYLSLLTNPTIALINNVGSAHLEGLKTEQQISNAKAEIFSGLGANGVAVINADDKFYSQWTDQLNAERKSVNVVTFGLKNLADVTLEQLQLELLLSQFDLVIGNDRITINLPLPGEHNVKNALAAAAISHAAGMDMKTIKAGLESIKAVKGRLNFRGGHNNSTVIDDSYNANPHSVNAGIDVLSKFEGRKILVLGAMAELGKASKELHIGIGEYARQKNIDMLLCLASNSNDHSKYYEQGFNGETKVYDDVDELVRNLKENLQKDAFVLVKGSKSSGMGRVVENIVCHRNDKDVGGKYEC